MEPAVYLNTWRFIPNNKIKNTHPNRVESEFTDENEKFFLPPVLAQVDPVLQNLSQGSEPWVSKRFNTATHKKKKKKSRIQLASERGQREEGINTWTALYWVLLKKNLNFFHCSLKILRPLQVSCSSCDAEQGAGWAGDGCSFGKVCSEIREAAGQL